MTRRMANAAALALVLVVVTAAPGGATGPVIPERNEVGPFLILEEGDSGGWVKALQERLTEARFFTGSIDGVYGPETASAVVAFHKFLDAPRTGRWEPLDWIRLRDLPEVELPFRPTEPDRVEIDIGRQLIIVIRANEVQGILPTSTGGSYIYWSERNQANVRAGTPRGDFTFSRYRAGWGCDSVTGWCVYNYWAFTPFYGIHGYGSVPNYPASHGCARLHLWNADWIANQLFVGMPVHIWDEMPVFEIPEPPPHALSRMT